MTKRIKAPFSKGGYFTAIPRHRRLVQTTTEDNLKAWINQCRIEGQSAHKELLDAWLDHEAECRDYYSHMSYEMEYYARVVGETLSMAPEAMYALAKKFNRQPFMKVYVTVTDGKCSHARITSNRPTHPRLCGAPA